MRNILLLLSAFFIITSNNCYSQKENNNWYFGFGAGITFNTPDGEPVALLNGKIFTDEGTAIASDKDGNLLFYTDGVTVWTKQHSMMANGTNLFGSSTSSHSALIVPMPRNNSIYYIFTTENRANLDTPNKIVGLRYSVVDLSLNGGLGEVTQKNIPLYKPSCEKLGAIKNINTDSYWIISHEWNSNRFFAHKVSSVGINTTPVISESGVNFAGVSTNATGRMAISPDGKLLALTYREKEAQKGSIELFDFDPMSGIVSNARSLEQSTMVYSCAFSGDGTKLYVKSDTSIYQYEVDDKNIQQIRDSKTAVTSNSGEFYYAMLRGPNGKIYIVNRDFEYLDEISFPNLKGTACTFAEKSVYLGGKISHIGLPTFVQSIFFVKNGENIEKDISVCEGENVQLDAGDIPTATEYLWYDQNDEFIATGRILQINDIALSDAGNYLCHINSTAIEIDTVVVHLTVRPQLDAYIEPTTKHIISCEADFVELEVFTNESGYSYLWSTGETTKSINATESGEYWVEVTTEGACPAYDTVLVTIDQNFEEVKINAPSGLMLCEGEDILLEASHEYDEYLWNTGETSRSILVNKPGTYIVRAENATGCFGIDSVSVTEHEFNVDWQNIDFADICLGGTAFQDVTISNLDNDTKTISGMYFINGENFSIIPGKSFPFEFIPGADLNFQVEFLPEFVDILTDTLLIQFSSPCQRSIKIPVRGSVNDDSKISVVINDSTVTTGEEYCIPVIGNFGCIGINIKELLFTIEFNPDLFYLNEITNGEIISKELTQNTNILRILIKDYYVENYTDTLLTLCGTIMLSNRDATEIAVSDISTGHDIPVSSESGTLYASDVCGEDMLKLKFGEIPEVSINPNPSSGGIINIVASKDSKGNFTVTVFNSIGEEVFSGIWEITGNGDNQYSIDSGKFSSGVYYLVINSGTYILLREKIMITK